MPWSIDITDADGATSIETGAPFNSARVTWSLEGPGALEVDLDRNRISDSWIPGLNAAIVRGDMEWIGELSGLDRTGTPSDYSFKASGLGLLHRLDFRVVRHDFEVHDTADVIVAALLQEAQDNQFNGDMGISMGSVSGSMIDRIRGYCVGVNIGDAIRDLASIGRGFDYEIDSDRNFNMWRDRGSNTGRTLSETDVETWEPTLDTSQMLTNVTAIADPSDPWGPKFRMSNYMIGAVFAANTYGRRETTIDTGIDANTESNPNWQDEMYDAAQGVLRGAGGAALTIHTKWFSDRAPWALGDVWLGDRVTATLPSYFGGDNLVRMIDTTVNIEPMPPLGVDDPIYEVETTWQGLAVDLTDGDPDSEDS